MYYFHNALINQFIIPNNKFKLSFEKSSYQVARVMVDVFLQRFMHYCLPTHLNLSKKGLDIQNIMCLVCNFGVNAANHRFFICKVATVLQRLIERWCGIQFPTVKNIKEWITWLDNTTMTKHQKDRLHVMMRTIRWMILRGQNNIVLGS